jgi:hypothetical protein
MIAPDQALRAIQGVDPARIANDLPDVLLSKRTLPIATDSDTMPEDFYIALLQTQHPELRDAVIVGCRKLLRLLEEYIDDPARVPDTNIERAFEHVSAIIDITAPEELAHRTKDLFRTVVEARGISDVILNAITRAAMAYVQTGEDIAVWERCLQRDDLAAYAFTALLRVRPDSAVEKRKHLQRIEGHLVDLWIRQLASNLDIDAASLTEDAVEAYDDQEMPERVMARLISARPDLLKPLRANLQSRDWSKSWAAFLVEKRRPVPFTTRRRRSRNVVSASSAQLCFFDQWRPWQSDETLIRSASDWLNDVASGKVRPDAIRLLDIKGTKSQTPGISLHLLRAPGAVDIHQKFDAWLAASWTQAHVRRKSGMIVPLSPSTIQ